MWVNNFAPQSKSGIYGEGHIHHVKGFQTLGVGNRLSARCYLIYIRQLYPLLKNFTDSITSFFSTLRPDTNRFFSTKMYLKERSL